MYSELYLLLQACEPYLHIEIAQLVFELIRICGHCNRSNLYTDKSNSTILPMNDDKEWEEELYASAKTAQFRTKNSIIWIFSYKLP